MAETQVTMKVKVLRSDNGKEFIAKAFNAFCTEHGIHHQLSAVYTPQQNGLAERKNRTLRTLMESARSMLQMAQLPTSFWAEAISTANYVQNKLVAKT